MPGATGTVITSSVIPSSSLIGASGNNQAVIKGSAANGLTALAGGGQTGATPITTKIARFTTVATGADSSLLPAAKAGLSILVDNSGAASMNVFPATGETINALSANTAFAVANAKRCLFFCAVDGKWSTLLTA